jgi:pimeloyl-ACP methyl ester carboxylesterase
MDDYVSARNEPAMGSFSRQKKYITVAPWEVAYVEAGNGAPLFLLHGCPFNSYEWSAVMPLLAPHYRVLAPDLLGLGDTRVRLSDDYHLPQQAAMIVGLMDALGIPKAYFVGHDHGAATLQLLMKHHPERIEKAVLTNAEAYDQWPSREERPYIKVIVNPLTSKLVRFALGFRSVQRAVFRSAVVHTQTLSDEVLQAFLRPHIATLARWQRLQRFFQGQLDPDNNRETLRVVDGLRRFNKPTLLLWGKQDEHFGTTIAKRLADDIPGAVGVKYLDHSAHLPMLEEPKAYANILHEFFATQTIAGNQKNKHSSSS